MNDTDRTGYIAAIAKLLEKADLRKLRAYDPHQLSRPGPNWPCL